MGKLTTTLGFCGISAIAATALTAQSTRQFLVDGNVVSDSVLQEGGRYWVPLDDVGRYFGYFVSVNPSQANLTKIPTAPTQGQAGQAQAALGQASQGAGSQGSRGSGMTGGQGSAPQPFVSGTGSQQNPVDPNQAQSNSQIEVKLGEAASVGGFDYKVTDIRDAGKQYKDAFDQRGTTLSPKFKTDSLVVVSVEETNRGTKPVRAAVPDASAVTVFDGKKVGYVGSYLDVRQSSDVVDKSSVLSLDLPNQDTPTVMLAPGGTLQFAVLASVPAGDAVNSVLMKVAGNESSGTPSGADVTVKR